MKEGVPKGEVLKFTFENSKIFPGTWREYWVYVPAQYDASKPACIYVNQDGVQWQAPVVFDNLIHKKEIPMTIGVFVMHGLNDILIPSETWQLVGEGYKFSEGPAVKFVTKLGVSMPLFQHLTAEFPISVLEARTLILFMPLAEIKCINEK